MIPAYCINKSLPEYKEVFKVLPNDTMITTLFISNGFKIPTVEQALRYKKDFEGSKYESEESQVIEKLHTLIKGKKEQIHTKNRLAGKLKYEYRTLRDTLKEEGGFKKDHPELIKLQNKRVEIESEIRKIRNEIEDIHLLDKRDKVIELGQKDLAKIDNILNKEEISPEDVKSAADIIHNWNIILDPVNSPLLDQEERESPGEYLNTLQKAMAELSGEFIQKNHQLTKWMADYYEELPDSKNLFRKNLSSQLREMRGSLYEVGDKGGINAAESEFTGIAESREMAYQELHQAYKEAITDFNTEISQLNDKIEDVFKDFSKEEKALFKQKASNRDNREVSSLTDISTYEYKFKLMEIMSAYIKKTQYIKQNPEIKYDSERKKALSRLAKNTIKEVSNISNVIDPKYFIEMTEDDVRLLGNDSEVTNIKKNEEINKLKELLHNDQTLYNRYVRQIEDIVDNYKVSLERFKQEVELETEDLAEQNRMIDEFIAEHSPFVQANNFKNKKIRIQSLRGSLLNQENMVLLPAKKDSKGNNLDYYDNDFKKIMSSDKLKQAYFFVHELYEQSQAIIPRDQLKGAHTLSMFPFEKGMLEMVKDSGSIAGAKALYEKVRMFGSNKANKPVPQNITYRRTQVEGLQNPFEFINQYIKVEAEKYKKQHGVEPDFQQRNEWRIEYLDKIAKGNTSDITRIFQSHAAAMLMFKHKSNIETKTTLLTNFINNIVISKIRKSNQSTQKTTEDTVNPAHLQNDLNRLNYTMAVLLGYNPKIKTSKKGKISAKVKSEDKKAYRELKEAINLLDEQLANNEIDKIKHTNEVTKIKEAMKSMEYQVDHITLLDGLNTYIRMKSMGWNIFSGVSNIGFGVVANTLMASDGRNFTMKDLMFGYRVITQSIGKSLTFGGVVSKEARKLANIMEKQDILKKSRYEVIEKKLNAQKSKLESFGPWNFIERGEYLNQGPIVVAGLKHKKVTYKGETVSLWDIIQENGYLPEDASREIQDAFVETKVNMEAYIRRGHGNYDTETPLKANEKVLTRLLKTFKTWMPQAYLTRFGVERPSVATNTVEKGRYRSFGSAYKYGIGGKGRVGTFGTIAKELIKKLWTNTDFDYYYNVSNSKQKISVEEYDNLSKEEQNNYQRSMSEVDAANMRANLTEMYWAAIFGVTIGLLSTLVKVAFDDEEEIAENNVRFWINILGRVESDIYMWISPVEFKNILKDPVPVTGIITDMAKLISTSTAIATGDESLKIETGPYADENRLWRYFQNIVPMLNAWKTYNSLGKSTYKDNQNFWYHRIVDFTEEGEED